MVAELFSEIEQASEAGQLFDLMSEFFCGQGFGGICYTAPATADAPYILLERGMPAAWMATYREQELHRFDPLPGAAFRLGRPARLEELLANLPNLNRDEQAFVEALKTSGIDSGLAIPTYGAFGRPGFVGLTQVAHPDLLDQMNIPLAWAVAQQVHHRMEQLQIRHPAPALSPREREILGWVAKGKSNVDIAAILSLAVPTVVTHIQRIYAKLQVHDRINCVKKAFALHFV